MNAGTAAAVHGVARYCPSQRALEHQRQRRERRHTEGRDHDDQGRPVAQQHRTGHEGVAGAVGRQVAAVLAQPVDRLRLEVLQCVLDAQRPLARARRRRGAARRTSGAPRVVRSLCRVAGTRRARVQCAEERAEVAAARHGRKEIDLAHEPDPGERPEDAEAERRAADAASRERDADRVGRQFAWLSPRWGSIRDAAPPDPHDFGLRRPQAEGILRPLSPQGPLRVTHPIIRSNHPGAE